MGGTWISCTYNVALGPFYAGAVKPQGGKPLFPLATGQSFDALRQQAGLLNARTLDNLPADISTIAPEIAAADRILFFTKPDLLKHHPLTSQELRFILNTPDALSRTQFVTGFFL